MAHGTPAGWASLGDTRAAAAPSGTGEQRGYMVWELVRGKRGRGWWRHSYQSALELVRLWERRTGRACQVVAL